MSTPSTQAHDRLKPYMIALSPLHDDYNGLNLLGDVAAMSHGAAATD